MILQRLLGDGVQQPNRVGQGVPTPEAQLPHTHSRRQEDCGHQLHRQVRVLQKLEQHAGATGVQEFQKLNCKIGRSKRMFSYGYHELVGFVKFSEYSLGRDRPALVGDLMSAALGPW